MGLYHVGSASCLQSFAPFLLQNKIAGASAGALTAAAIIGNVALPDIAREVLKVVVNASEKILGPFNPNFNLNNMLKEGLTRLLPDDIHLVANNKLYISITRAVDRKNIIVSQFDSKEDLINVLLASSFIPFLSGYIPPRYNGDLVLDGGYSDNVPTFQGNTITVSPFSGDQDISPEDTCELGALLNLQLSTGPTTSITVSRDNIQRLRMALIPPKPEDLLSICEQGFRDTFRFLNTRNIIQCVDCRAEKLAANLGKLEEWRKPQGHNCAGCHALFRDAKSLSLPQEIYRVFQESLQDMRLRNSVWFTRCSIPQKYG